MSDNETVKTNNPELYCDLCYQESRIERRDPDFEDAYAAVDVISHGLHYSSLVTISGVGAAGA